MPYYISKKGKTMNYFSKRLLASVVLAGLALGSVDARGNKRKHKSSKHDPIVGIWNMEFANPAGDPFQWVVRFDADGTYSTLVSEGLLQTTNPDAPPFFETVSYGKWKNVGHGQYINVHSTVILNKVPVEVPGSPILAPLTYNPSARFVVTVEMSIDKNGRTGTANLAKGLVFAPGDICLETVFAEFEINSPGTVCKFCPEIGRD